MVMFEVIEEEHKESTRPWVAFKSLQEPMKQNNLEPWPGDGWSGGEQVVEVELKETP